MLNKIWLEFRMSFSISNFFMGYNECHRLTKFFCRLVRHYCRDAFRHLFIIKVLCSIGIMFIFNYHVMQYYTCLHNVIKSLYSPKMCRPMNNCKLCLKHSKCTLYIIPCWLLSCSKKTSFSTLWSWDCLYKSGPWRIYTISKIVSHCIIMTIDWVIHRRCMAPLSELGKYKRMV